MTAQSLHTGHRARMREKFLKYGKDAFCTHELLEMILYHAIPVRDTNETAIKLLSDRGGLDGVFSASTDELLLTDGVGENVAAFIRCVGKMSSEFIYSAKNPSRIGGSYRDVGEFCVELFRDTEEQCVIAMPMNNKLEIISAEKVFFSDYGVGAVNAAGFIDIALREGASSVAIAHNHPFGAAFPTPQDIETNKAVENALADLGILLAEHYIVSGNSYIGFMHHMGEGLQNVNLSLPNADCLIDDSQIYLGKILAYVSENPQSDATLLLRAFHGLSGLCESDIHSIADALSGSLQTAICIKLVFALASRRETDRFKFKRRHTDREICDYLSALMLDASREMFCMLSLSAEGKVISSDILSSGTVNAIGISPREVLEIARRRQASAVILAHNHPRGFSIPSEDDISGTERLRQILLPMGIDLINHYIVASGDVRAVRFER